MKSRSPSPLIRSSVVLRGIATAVTLTSLGGMTSFAAQHVQNAAAPLQPSASPASAVTTPAATPAPTARNSTRRSTTITGVATTTTTARTKTKSS